MIKQSASDYLIWYPETWFQRCLNDQTGIRSKSKYVRASSKSGAIKSQYGEWARNNPFSEITVSQRLLHTECWHLVGEDPRAFWRGCYESEIFQERVSESPSFWSQVLLQTLHLCRSEWRRWKWLSVEKWRLSPHHHCMKCLLHYYKVTVKWTVSPGGPAGVSLMSVGLALVNIFKPQLCWNKRHSSFLQAIFNYVFFCNIGSSEQVCWNRLFGGSHCSFSTQSLAVGSPPSALLAGVTSVWIKWKPLTMRRPQLYVSTGFAVVILCSVSCRVFHVLHATAAAPPSLPPHSTFEIRTRTCIICNKGWWETGGFKQAVFFFGFMKIG